MLPPTLPSSIEHKVGYITYSLSVVVERKIWAHKEFKVKFSVIKKSNLSDHPLAQVIEFVQYETKRHFFFIKTFHLLLLMESYE